MNILIFNWRDPKNPQSGGAEIVTQEHAKAWVQRGHTVTWFTARFTNSPDKEILEGVTIIRRGNALSVYLFAPFYYLFHRKKFDIVIDEIHGLPFFTPLYVRKPKIAFIHEVAAEIWDYMYPFPINKIGKFIEPLYFRLYTAIPFWVVANSAVADLKKYGISSSHCTVINNAISNTVLTQLPVKEKNSTYIFVSRVVKMKGIEEIIKAFGFIHKEDKNAQLWIVGRGDDEYLHQLKQMVVEYGIEKNVTFFGNVSQQKKLELMQRAHILLHASIKEGWGLVIIEAASQATPAIVYDVSGLRDSVKDNKTGFILHENSPREMATKAVSLIDDKKQYKQFQDNGLAWAKSLTWKKATEESNKFIMSLV
ncbi:MAG TPA: glycosyltransferase family 4 protein [Candidatus Saccharimonadales bacterium]|nr:glycosyltransferase family 4 protein [Candidatus Saccharimonadales bacterium]